MTINHDLINHVIYHHFKISAQSPLIPYDRSLYTIVNNSIHIYHGTQTNRYNNSDTTHPLLLYLPS